MAEFDPRRAEPGQEFTYTGTRDEKLAAGEDLPDGVDVIGVDDETGERTIRRYGVEISMKADKDGVVRPKTAADEAVLNGFGLPVARSAKAESKASDAEKEG